MTSKKIVIGKLNNNTHSLSPMQYIGPGEIDEFKKYDKIFVVCFTASWCGPCKKIKPILKQLQEKHISHCTFLFVDVDAHEGLCTAYGVRAMPTFVIFRGGVVVTSFKGADPEMVTNEVAKIERCAYYHEFKPQMH